MTIGRVFTRGRLWPAAPKPPEMRGEGGSDVMSEVSKTRRKLQ